MDANELHQLVKQHAGEFVGFSGLFDLLVRRVLPEGLRGVFEGAADEYEDDLEVIRKTEERFTMITLNTKYRTLQSSLEAFKCRSSDKCTTALEVSESPPVLVVNLSRTAREDFVFPQTLTLNLAGKAHSDRIQSQVDEVDTKILKIERLLDQKDFQDYQDSLACTLRFLEAQEFMNLEDAGLGLEELSCSFGVYGGEEQHEDTKRRLKFYMDKLDRHEEALRRTHAALIQAKEELVRKENSDRYSLFGVLAELRDDLHCCFIYNEKDRRWRKFHDKKVCEVAEAEVKQVGYECAVALFYKLNGMVCSPAARK